jgi:hypothetical protein
MRSVDCWHSWLVVAGQIQMSADAFRFFLMLVIVAAIAWWVRGRWGR